MYKFKFADIGEGLHEGTVGEIYVKEGQEVKEGDSLFSVETDKVTSDIPAPTSGTIALILIKTGKTVHVGDVIFHINNGDESSPEIEEDKPKAASEDAASVVGSIEVSDKLFSFDNFNKPQKTDSSSQHNKNVASKVPKKIVKNDSLFVSSEQIFPTGNGEKVDVVIIGAGPGGYDLAARISKQGLKTVVIEDRFAGGVCLNIGCIPTKALLKGAKVHNHISHANNLGLEIDMKNLKINWQKMQQRKVDISKKLEKSVEYLITSSKGEFIKGVGKIIDKHNVEVGKRKFTTKYIIVASGSRPVVLNLQGFKKGYKDGTIIDSTGALSLKEIPKELVIIGGGVIGVEFATLFNELGSKVTILEGAPSILNVMDKEIQKLTTQLLTKNGIVIKTSVKVKEFVDGHVKFEEDGKDTKISVDKLLVSVGRAPNNLSLDKTLGIKLGKRGEILVNDIMQTNVSNVFAIGDVVGHAMLAHTAYKHAAIVGNIFKGQTTFYDKNAIPGCVYIYPEISSIGRTEEQLRAENIDYLVSKWQNVNIGRALAENDTLGFTKILFDPVYGLVLGAHIINASSSEMISEIGAVMELEGTVFELASIVHPHPSVSEGIFEAATHAVEMLEKGAK